LTLERPPRVCPAEKLAPAGLVKRKREPIGAATPERSPGGKKAVEPPKHPARPAIGGFVGLSLQPEGARNLGVSYLAQRFELD